MAEDRIEREIVELIERHGGRRESMKGHLKYVFPDGRTFTTSLTPSDKRAMMNCLANLRRFLGVARPAKKPSEKLRPPRKMNEAEQAARSRADHEAIMGTTGSMPSMRSELAGVWCWPVHTPDRARLSAHAWLRFRDRLPGEERRESARRIAAALRRFGLTVPDAIAEGAR